MPRRPLARMWWSSPILLPSRSGLRFYEIGTNRPFFCGRDGIKKYSLAEIENERRTGYSWYGDEPSHGLDDFKTWQPEWVSDSGTIDP